MKDEHDIPVTKPIQRLCNEIQLFDLCDLESCNYKEARYCTNQDLIERFEDIAEEDVRQTDQYQGVEQEDADADDDYGDSLDNAGYDDEEDGWDG